MKTTEPLSHLKYLASRTGASALLVLFIQPIILGCSMPEDTTPQAVSRSDPEMIERRRALLDRKALEQVPDPTGPITGEVPPDVMETVMLALEKLTGAMRTEFKIIRAEETIWPNGALGCPLPGINYTQATMPGFHIVLEHKGLKYDYRADGKRYLLLCQPRGPEFRPSTQAPTS
jgi:hypothetical protein